MQCDSGGWLGAHLSRVTDPLLCRHRQERLVTGEGSQAWWQHLHLATPPYRARVTTTSNSLTAPIRLHIYCYPVTVMIHHTIYRLPPWLQIKIISVRPGHNFYTKNSENQTPAGGGPGPLQKEHQPPAGGGPSPSPSVCWVQRCQTINTINISSCLPSPA